MNSEKNHPSPTLSRQNWRADDYADNARFVADLGESLIAWLNPQAGEKILDLGCGDGALTAKLLPYGCEVLGVDGSENLLSAARARGLSVRCLDGQKLDYVKEFDAVFSNAALHWMTDAEAVVAGVARALKSGGRFVAEMGGTGNVATIVTAIRAALARRGVTPPAVWYFPGAEEYGALLEKHGFSVERIVLFPRPTPLPTGIEGWLKTFIAPWVAGLDEHEKTAIIQEIVHDTRTTLCDENGQWTADYMRLRFVANKKA